MDTFSDRVQKSQDKSRATASGGKKSKMTSNNKMSEPKFLEHLEID